MNLQSLKPVCILLFLHCTTPTQAWWGDGHAYITVGAVYHLEEDLRFFFELNIEDIAILSGQEPPGTHFIDIDAYPTFNQMDTNSVPRDLETLIELYGPSFVNDQGTAPWTTVGYIDELTNQMATASTAQDWQNLIMTSARISHFIGDLHNPLHLTQNYNGQLTGNDDIHSRYEGEMVSRNLDSLLLIPSDGNLAEYLDSPLDSLFDDIYIYYPYVDNILLADSEHRVENGGYGGYYLYPESYYSGMWIDTGEFTQQAFRDASRMIASMWYTTWVNAGSPAPLFPPGQGDADLDGDVDLVDFSWFQACYTEHGNEFPKARCSQLDFDGDRDIDELDFQNFESAMHGIKDSMQ